MVRFGAKKVDSYPPFLFSPTASRGYLLGESSHDVQGVHTSLVRSYNPACISTVLSGVHPNDFCMENPWLTFVGP